MDLCSLQVPSAAESLCLASPITGWAVGRADLVSPAQAWAAAGPFAFQQPPAVVLGSAGRFTWVHTRFCKAHSWMVVSII